jgi:hypothetical protein
MSFMQVVLISGNVFLYLCAAPLLFSAFDLQRMGKKVSLLFGVEGRGWVSWIDPILTRSISDYNKIIR